MDSAFTPQSILDLLKGGGWVPVLSAVADGSRRVLKVTDWTGGVSGASKPEVGVFMGVSGLVADVTQATDIRGAVGTVGPSALVRLPNITLAQSAIVAIVLGIRTLTVTGVTGLLKDDFVVLSPVALLPDGYAIHNAIATADGTLKITLTAPALALGANYSINCQVAVLR